VWLFARASCRPTGQDELLKPSIPTNHHLNGSDVCSRPWPASLLFHSSSVRALAVSPCTRLFAGGTPHCTGPCTCCRRLRLGPSRKRFPKIKKMPNSSSKLSWFASSQCSYHDKCTHTAICDDASLLPVRYCQSTRIRQVFGGDFRILSESG
jgi:hypothetical protein